MTNFLTFFSKNQKKYKYSLYELYRYRHLTNIPSTNGRGDIC